MQAVNITAVSQRQTKNGRTVFDITASDGLKYACWEAGIATGLFQAQQHGQAVVLQAEVTQNGQYTNRTIKGFDLPGAVIGSGIPPAAPDASPVIGQPVAGIPQATPPAATTAGAIPAASPTDRDTAIFRQSALARAIEQARVQYGEGAGVEESVLDAYVEQRALHFLRYFEQGQFPTGVAVASATATQGDDIPWPE